MWEKIWEEPGTKHGGRLYLFRKRLKKKTTTTRVHLVSGKKTECLLILVFIYGG